MSVQRIASRYAKSVIDLAKETNKMDELKQDMDVLGKALESRDLFLLLKSPIVKSDKKAEIMKAVFEGKLNPLMMGFVNLLVAKGREPHLPEVVAEFQAQHKKLNNITTMTITTAEKLDESAINSIKEEFLKSSATDKKIEVVTDVDANLIGGFIVRFGDKLYDASVRRKLDNMKKEFMGNSYTSQIVAR